MQELTTSTSAHTFDPSFDRPLTSHQNDQSSGLISEQRSDDGDPSGIRLMRPMAWSFEILMINSFPCSLFFVKNRNLLGSFDSVVRIGSGNVENRF